MIQKITKVAHKILLIACVMMCFGCQKKKVENTSDIECILTLDKTNYKLGDKVFVNVIIKNNMNKEIVISEWPSVEKMIFSHYVDGERKTVVDIADFEKPTNRKTYVALFPKEEMFWGPSEFGDEYFNETGKWDLKIIREYNFTGEDFGVKAWTGILESNTIELLIEKRSTGVPPKVLGIKEKPKGATHENRK